MAKKDYQMTTVYNYLKLLDKEVDEQSKVGKAAEKYLLQARKNKNNAEILEQLLA